MGYKCSGIAAKKKKNIFAIRFAKVNVSVNG